MKPRHRSLLAPLALLAAIALTAALVACGDDEDEADAGGAPAATQGAGGAAATVTAVLREFSVELDKKTAPTGNITFKAQNKGAIPHELVIIKSDLAPDKLPTKDGGKFVDQSKVQTLGDTKEFDGGKTKELALTLQPGKYVLICDVASHYQTGMRAAFAVE